MEDNRLIAEFMGYKTLDNYYYLLPITLPQFRGSDHAEWCSQHEASPVERFWEINDESLQYNTSWEWLMPVVEKIGNLKAVKHSGRLVRVTINIENGINVVISQMIGGSIANSYCHFQAKLKGNKETTLIENVYHSVIEFIKWYNKNEKA